MERKIKRGDIYYANLNPVIGSEQGGTRPVLIISNDVGNKHSPTVIVAPITSRIHTKAKLPTHTLINDFEGLDKNSIILFEQIRPLLLHSLCSFSMALLYACMRNHAMHRIYNFVCAYMPPICIVCIIAHTRKLRYYSLV